MIKKKCSTENQEKKKKKKKKKNATATPMNTAPEVRVIDVIDQRLKQLGLLDGSSRSRSSRSCSSFVTSKSSYASSLSRSGSKSSRKSSLS